MVVQVLLTHHADVNAAGTSKGWAPLHFASWYGCPTVARVLLEHGADVNFKTTVHETPLRLLSERDGNMEHAQLLLERGADPHLRCSVGRDSLYMALRKGHLGLAHTGSYLSSMVQTQMPCRWANLTTRIRSKRRQESRTGTNESRSRH